MSYKEDDLVLCKVTKIEGTTVFVVIEEKKPGSMVLSEVAAGRIRNLRQYVYPNKIIVCKILKITNETIELSLRRVTAKEREQVLERYKKERTFENILSIFGEKAKEILNKIKEDYSFLDFLEEIKDNPKILEKYVKKENVDKIYQRLKEKSERNKTVMQKIKLRSLNSNGIEDLKDILNVPNSEIHYEGSSVFSITTTGKEFKEAENKLNSVLEEIEKKAKAKKVFFERLKEKSKIKSR